MDLYTTISGEAGPLPPVLLVHGLFGTGRNLGGLARRMPHRQSIQVDLRNHGQSPWSDDHSYGAMADDLAGVIAAQGGAADVVGHSMGGKAAMVLALRRPEAVRRLVILDIAPVAYGHDQIALIDKMRGMDRSNLRRRLEADARLAGMGVEDEAVRGFLLQSLDLTAEPEARWRMNLDVLRRASDDLAGWPAEALMPGAFAGPMLVLYGGTSDYVTDAGRAAFAHWFPQAELHVIPDTGHWLHSERAGEVGDRVAAFLG